jgi:phage I-like protein
MSHRLALNVELIATDGAAPEWVPLIPAGPDVVGLDGRRWLYDTAAEVLVLDSFTQRGLDLAIDINHALQHAAPKGGESPAAAWIDKLEPRDGAMWGHVAWTPRGGEAVVNREYRYLSPVFDYESATGRIARLVSVGLVNTPNLRQTALNSEEPPVALSAAIALALGLNAEATDETAVAAINTLKTARAANSENPSLERFVPRADYDAMQTRATNAEQTLATQKKADHDTAVNAEITAALQAGKITPATEGFYRASCADEAGLASFKTFVGVAPVIAADQANLDKKAAATATALNAEEAAMCESLCIEPAAFLAAKADM